MTPAWFSSSFGRGARLSALALAPLLSAGCIEPFETPSEYASQRYLCSDENQDAWAKAVSDCADDPECGGVVSFTGRLEGVDVTVESRQVDTIFRQVHVTATDERLLDRVDTFGASPYFDFGIKMKSVGGSATTETGARGMTVDGGAERLEDHRGDERLTLDLRLTSGNESVELAALKGGTVLFEEQTADTLRGSFDSSFGTETDHVEGCFALFATEVNTSVD